MAAELHVSIAAETVINIAGFEISNSMLTGTIVSVLIILFALYFSSQKLQKKKIGAVQNIVELFVESIYNLCKDIAGTKRARDFFPLIASFLLFILLNNWFGLLPGVGTIGVTQPVEVGVPEPVHAAEETIETTHEADVVAATEEENLYGVLDVEEDPAVAGETHETSSEHSETAMADESHDGEEEHHTFIPLLRAATADLNGTLALAIISMVLVQFYGVKYQGMKYFTKFFNFSHGPIFTFVGLLELVSDISKIISFAFRLFGNIFAGEVLLAVISFLVPVLAPLPFLGLEIFVGFVQALVFSMLSLVFINMATESHDH